MTYKTFAIGGLLMAAAGASAQLSSVGPFFGTYGAGFEGHPNYLNGGSYNSLTIMGGEATLTASGSVGSQLNIYNPTGLATFALAGGLPATVEGGVKGLGLFNMGSPVNVTLTFANTVNYFGGYFADFDGAPETLQFFNSAGNPLLPPQTITNVTSTLSWQGWYAPSGISKIEFGGGMSTAMDNLQAGDVPFATPEPGAMVVLGVGVLGLLIRRRR